MVGEAGLEPATPGLEGRCSVQLSYSPLFFHCSFEMKEKGATLAMAGLLNFLNLLADNE